MAKIKSFKESINEYYQEISESEFEEGGYKPINFTHEDDLNKWIESQPGFNNTVGSYRLKSKNIKGETVNLDDIFKSFWINDIFYIKRGLQKRNGVQTYRIEADNLFCIIFESFDEWFWVNLEINDYKNSYFKCDQFEGLTKLLKDKKVI
jgi:hypothetical protein